MSFIGNTFHCVAVAFLVGYWAFQVGLSSKSPDVADLWKASGVSSVDEVNLCEEQSSLRTCPVIRMLMEKPRHELGDWEGLPQEVISKLSEFETNENTIELAFRQAKVDRGYPSIAGAIEMEEQVYHLVQQEDEIADILSCEVPPDDYYVELRRLLGI